MLAAQKEVEGGDVVQQYACTNEVCGKQYTSFEVFNLLRGDLAGQDGVERDAMYCDICGGEVSIMVGGGDGAGGPAQAGTNEERKERVKVRG